MMGTKPQVVEMSDEDKMWSRAFDLASTGEYMDASIILKEVCVDYPDIWVSLGQDPERFYFLRELAFKVYHNKGQTH